MAFRGSCHDEGQYSLQQDLKRGFLVGDVVILLTVSARLRRACRDSVPCTGGPFCARTVSSNGGKINVWRHSII